MMQQRGGLTRGDTITYALGIVVDTVRGLRRLSHGGADAGYRTFVAYFPSLDAGVITLGKSARFNAGGVAMQTADAFFGDAMGQVRFERDSTSHAVTRMRITAGRVRNLLFERMP